MNHKNKDIGLLERLVRWANGDADATAASACPKTPDGVSRVSAKKRADFGLRFYQWKEDEGAAVFSFLYRILAVAVCLVVILTLLVTVSSLPRFADPENPTNNEVSRRYIEQGLQETGATNIVASMILDYRAFDTLGEAHVLFTAVCCVLILLRCDRRVDGEPNIPELSAQDDAETEVEDLILSKTAMLLIPLIFLYGIYVILNGHLSAGGGFSGGAVLGAGLIMYRCTYGEEKTRRLFTMKTFIAVSGTALLAYAVLKGYAFYTGANHLPSGFRPGTPGDILSGGLILPLNICVGCVVACTIYSFFALFRKGDI